MDEQALAIDIQLKKLLDWLVSRRICNRQWHEKVIPIREKIGHAIGDMPEHPAIKDLLSGTSINYFHCLKIVEILRETEKDTKNFFGSYGSQRMKDWSEVVSLYQKESVYLAEAAQLLSQSVTYELPGLKKQLQKAVATQGECDKREKDNDRKAVEFRNEFEKSCKQLGIEGKSIRREIIALLDELPKTYADVAQDCKKLDSAIAIYKAFVKDTEDEKNVLGNLSFLIARGNVTTYEWTHGEAPLSVEEPQLEFGNDEDEEGEGDDGGGIDFGDDDDGAIDFGDSGNDEVVLETGDIDWGGVEEAGTEDIDWGVSSADAIDLETAGITVEDGGVEGGVAREAEALSLLDNRRTRTLILDDLAELECFLEQRVIELKTADDGKFMLGGGSTGDGAGENEDELSAFVADIRAIVGTLTAGKLHHLQLIRSSPAYVERMVKNLKTKLDLEEKMKLSNTLIADKRDAAIQEQAQLQAKFDLGKVKVKELQKCIEEDISGRYKGRDVNIMGGAQSL